VAALRAHVGAVGWEVGAMQAAAGDRQQKFIQFEAGLRIGLAPSLWG
jgi:hypothetical protein